MVLLLKPQDCISFRPNKGSFWSKATSIDFHLYQSKSLGLLTSEDVRILRTEFYRHGDSDVVLSVILTFDEVFFLATSSKVCLSEQLLSKI